MFARAALKKKTIDQTIDKTIDKTIDIC